MSPSTRSWCIIPLFLIGSTVAEGQGISLLRWEGKAKVISSRGVGVEQFRLRAEARWDKGASRDAGKYRLQVLAPGGRTYSMPMADEDGASAHWVTAHFPADAVRNLLPSSVVVNVTVVDVGSGRAISNTLTARIDDFPHPVGSTVAPDLGPFGWGEAPEKLSGGALAVPRPSPQGLRFVALPVKPGEPLVLASTSEASNAQVQGLLRDYDPTNGRSDEFNLEAPNQPALNLSPRNAETFLQALTASDPAGVVYRLPTRTEWKQAARAGTSSRFWWGDGPKNPKTANLVGPEPGLEGDSTDRIDSTGFAANPWGLRHAFGNVAEWATDSANGFVRLGGHFRTEPDEASNETDVKDAKSVGPDPYVGVRPFAEVVPNAVLLKARAILAANPRLREVSIDFDPARLTLVLTGRVELPKDRRAADNALGPLWIVAAVDDRIETPSFPKGRLARIGRVVGPPRRITPLGRGFDELPVSVTWADALPVEGSEWWVNVFLPGGTHYAHRLPEDEPNRAGRITVLIDLGKLKAAGLPEDSPVTVALSLGNGATRLDDPRVVSDAVEISTRIDPVSRP